MSAERARRLSELGLPVNATDRDVKKAYHEWLLGAHPDKGGDGATFAEKRKPWLYFGL